jgi:hypothetical protein
LKNYICIFYENDFQDKSNDMIFHISKFNDLKVIRHLYSKFIKILFKMTSFGKSEEYITHEFLIFNSRMLANDALLQSIYPRITQSKYGYCTTL